MIAEADRVKAEDDRVAPIVKRLKEEMKNRKTWDFKTCVYIVSGDNDWEIEVGISYDAVYQPAYISGPPEDCYPDESSMDITDMVILDDLPEGLTDAMVRSAAEDAEDRIIEEAWEDYDSKKNERYEP